MMVISGKGAVIMSRSQLIHGHLRLRPDFRGVTVGMWIRSLHFEESLLNEAKRLSNAGIELASP